MSIKFTKNPKQKNPPSKLGDRIYLDFTLEAKNEPLPAEVKVELEVRPKSKQLGFRLVQGEKRTVKMKKTTEALTCWFVLAGPKNHYVVQMTATARLGSSQQKVGFAVVLTDEGDAE